MDQTPENRKTFIKALLKESFNREVIELSSLGRDSNNFVYQIDLSVDNTGNAPPAVDRLKPGTIPLPTNIRKAVIRISNPLALVNHETRVENEVAAMTLMRDALSSLTDQLVPQVYDWASSSNSNSILGFILQEYKSGVGLDKAFGYAGNNEIKGLAEGKKRWILRQIAEVLKLIQTYRLPTSIQGYGGLRFNETGQIVTGPTTIPYGGPFKTLQEMYTQALKNQLQEADRNHIVRGWREAEGNLRERLDRLARDQGGIAKIVEENSVQRPTLVHGDFDIFNMLFDNESYCLTALLDFDFVHVATPAEEFFYSMASLGHLLLGPLEEGEEQQWVKYLLGEGDESLATKEDGEGIPWGTMKLVSDEFAEAGVMRPQDIKGVGELAGVRWFLEDVFPPYFASPGWLKKRTPEKIEKIRSQREARIREYLARWGY
ncbi:putative Aminoglycoside phosphotransferase domain-containing protein [Seiridium unicorne]|uniref:Aminoglycoside phosphotransferase domain-containing protein n=1 Tax=Seiridium unicorne TaxID=138068 RepID=A0ABR2VHT3_9PEZI